MAVFQKTKRRADTAVKRKLSPDDIAFLKTLQTELNTQDDMCQADPRFWVIAGTKETITTQGFEDETYVIDTETGEPIDKNLANALAELKAAAQNAGIDVSEHDSIEDILERLDDAGIHRYEMQYVKTEKHIYPDTMFLTHKDAENHLRQFGYNYDRTAHAFAMTAQRSPSVKTLWEILQHVDWSEL